MRFPARSAVMDAARGATMTDESPTGRHRLWSPAQRARLVRLCAAVSGDAAAAEDLAQEALLEAWRHQHRLTDPAGSEAWLNAVARNVCRRHLRSRGQDRAVPTESVPD